MIQILNNNNLKKIASCASIITAILLISIKLFAYIKTDSLAIFSSFFDSITDLFASFASFIAIYFSTKPANKNHRYGFGKTEALSAFLQAILITYSGCFIIYDAIDRIIHPIEIVNTTIGLAVMITSIAITLLLILLQNYVAIKTSSIAIKADMMHYTVDLLTNSMVVFSLLVAKFFNFTYFDIITAFLISFYLLYNAYNIAKDAIDLIIDKELSIEIRDTIINTVSNNKSILGIHDLRTRNLGNKFYFEMHVELNGNISLFEAHKITENVEKSIASKFPESQILIHQDPSGIIEDRLDHKINGSCDL